MKTFQEFLAEAKQLNEGLSKLVTNILDIAIKKYGEENIVYDTGSKNGKYLLEIENVKVEDVKKLLRKNKIEPNDLDSVWQSDNSVFISIRE